MSAPTSSKFEIRLPLLLACTLALGMFIGQKLPHTDPHFRFISGSQANGTASRALDETLRYIEAKYVDTVDVANLKKDAISQLLAQLDPHSVYISPEELARVEEDMTGNFEGVGIEFLLIEDTIRVVTPLSGGPAETAGIMAGDKIVRIDDSLVAGVKIDNEAIFKKLRGEKGSSVRVDVLRGASRETRRFTILRDVIPVQSVDVAYMLDEQTGYIKINRFSARTHQEFMEALRPLKEQHNMRHLVLDLRGNPGGYLNEAVDILSQLFSEGKLLVYTAGRTEERFDYKSTGRAQFDIDKLAVLIDEGSASASEIIAGAVQDHDRGWLIGRRSFGRPGARTVPAQRRRRAASDRVQILHPQRSQYPARLPPQRPGIRRRNESQAAGRRTGGFQQDSFRRYDPVLYRYGPRSFRRRRDRAGYLYPAGYLVCQQLVLRSPAAPPDFCRAMAGQSAAKKQAEETGGLYAAFPTDERRSGTVAEKPAIRKDFLGRKRLAPLSKCLAARAQSAYRQIAVPRRRFLPRPKRQRSGHRKSPRGIAQK